MKRLGIFAHFDAQNEIKGYIRHYLRSLREHCQELIFVSVSRLPEAAIAEAKADADRVLLRPNVGFDFGMWKHALSQVTLADYDELLLTNSSVFGPVTPLGPILARMSSDPCDAWAMTDNQEFRWHLQSYFLLFKSRLLRSPDFREFWSSVEDLDDKLAVIRKYEVGSSSFFKERGYQLKAAFSYIDAANAFPLERRLRPHLRWLQAHIFRMPIPPLKDARAYNPTSTLPDSLLELGMPFIKVELMRENPYLVPLAPVRRAIARSGYDPRLIEFDRPRVLHGWPFD